MFFVEQSDWSWGKSLLEVEISTMNTPTDKGPPRFFWNVCLKLVTWYNLRYDDSNSYKKMGRINSFFVEAKPLSSHVTKQTWIWPSCNHVTEAKSFVSLWFHCCSSIKRSLVWSKCFGGTLYEVQIRACVTNVSTRWKSLVHLTQKDGMVPTVALCI